MQLPLLTNYDANEEKQYRWMLDLPKALGLKNGMFSHGYHISDAQQRFENFILVNTGGTNCRFHMIAFDKTKRTIK